MRRIDISSYEVQIVDNEGNESTKNFDVRDSIINSLFNPNLRLKGRELLKQNKLALKVEECEDGELLLEEEEYNRVKQAVDKLEGLNRNFVEFVERIYEAEKVDPKELKGDE